uniref:GIR1-like zinc ribbon domain-containing protein n=1 Tax=Noccaea caerulescens TaxID=107243 RepID=A0A1J3JWZ0_NOCCA
MTADVRSLVRIPSRYNDDRTAVMDSAGPRSTVALRTRDLLGSGGCGVGGRGDQSLELDLDLQVPNGWEKRLDLKSGKVYLQQCNSTSSSSSTHHYHHHAEKSNQTVPRFQDLNFPPFSGKPPAKPLLNLFDDTSLELKLVPSLSRPPAPPSSSSSSSSNPSLSYQSPLSVPSANSSFQSVCTLDKVKSALERAEINSTGLTKKRQSPDDGVWDRTASAAASPVAVGCPGCLSYVLVMKNNPKCPRCQSFVPLPDTKKLKIDLNISI